MGSNFSKLIEKNPVTLSKVKYKKVAVATYSELFHALKSKEQTVDAQGNSTTHITSMFFRIVNLIDNKLKPAFILDGKFPEIKRHQKISNELSLPRKTNKISPEMIAELKVLFELMGLPVIQAPTEEEAQAAHLCQKDEVWAVVSRSFDPLMYGAPRVFVNAATAKKKKEKKDILLNGTYLVDIKKLTKNLKIDTDQLIILNMLLGTKFNPAIVGLSPHQALYLVNKWKDFGKLFKYAGWNYAYTWKEVYDCIKTLPITNKYKLKWNKPKKEQLYDLLVNRYNLGEKKVKNALGKLA